MVSSLWYLEEFCDSQHSNFEDWGVLPQTSQDFLRNLHLPQIHPFCSNNADDDDALIFPNAPAMGPYKEPFFFSRSHVGFLQDLMESLVTLWYFYIPPSAAFIQLWILLLAGYIAAVGLAYLAWRRWCRCRCRCRCRWKQKHNASAITVVTIVAAWVIMTDDQYVRIGSFGRLYGLFFMVGTIVLTLPVRPVLLAFLFFSLGLIFPWSSDDPEEIHNNIYPGLYYNPRIAFMDRMVQVWDVPEYSQITTPWQLTGDARTAFPYLMNNLKKQPKFHRVWQPTVDGEYVALDIAFPKTGHDSSQPLYLILHGLNGGSEEGYVLDFTESRIEKRSTVVVLVARGLMDTPIQGWTLYNGIRTSDAHSAASILRERVLQPNQVFGGVGYSLGAIVLNNYVANYGDQVELDVSVAISGALNTLFQKDFVRSGWTWQPMIAAHMKDVFFAGKWGQRVRHQLGKQKYQELLRATNVVDVDRYVGAAYNGYDSLTDFYLDMSALPPNKTRGNHIAIPHLLLQAFDDPISTWRSVASNDPSDSLYPWNLVQNQENVVLLLTEKGGHVGWPIGWCPNSWKYMNDYIAAGFVNAYQDTRKSNFAHAHKRSPKMRNETYVNSKSKNKNTNISVADELLHRPLALRNTSLRYMLSFSKKRQSIIGSCRGVSKNDHG